MGLCKSKQTEEPAEHPSLQHKSNTNPAVANQQHAMARAASRQVSKRSRSKPLGGNGSANPSVNNSFVDDEKDGEDGAPSATQEVQSLLTIPFFQELGNKNLKDLRSIFTRKTFEKDEIIVSEGQKESVFHVIINGAVSMTAKNSQGESVEVMELKKGDWFGEIFLMEDHIQPVTVRALESSTILYINSHNFNQAIKKFPDLSVSVDVIGRHPPISIQLKKVPFFADVSELKLHLLGTLCDVRRSLAGQIICQQGADADGMYFIIQGRVEVSANGPEGKVYLDTLTNGDWFGEIALLEQTRRTATVTATQDCMLLYLSRAKFDRFLRVAPEVLESGLFETIIRKRTANSLKAIPIFAVLRTKHVGPMQQFDERRLALLGQLFRFVNIEQGSVICSEGEPGENFFIIVRGVCTVTAKAPDQQDVFLAELSANEWFGETALMMSQQAPGRERTRCNATVTAKTACVLLRLSGENFQQFLHIAPEVEEVFKARVSVRTAERLRKIPFFSAVRENKPWSKLDLLGGLFQFEEYPTDTIIFREGSLGEKFYVIVAGQVEVCVQRAGSFYLLDTLQPDDWFGEIALMKNTPRTATITTKGDCVLLSITADKFKKFLTIAPELAEPFNALLSHRTANMLKTLDLFKQLHENKPWSKLEMLGALFNYEQHKQNEVVYRIGDPGDKFFLIVNGRVRVEDAHGHSYILSSQQHFGELAVLRKTKREATVTTLDEHNIFLYLNQGAFDQFISVAPELKQYFDNLVTQRAKLSMDFTNKKQAEEKAKEGKEAPLDLVSIRIDEATSNAASPTVTPRIDNSSNNTLKPMIHRRNTSESVSTSAVNFNFHHDESDADDEPHDTNHHGIVDDGTSSPNAARYRIIQ